MIKVSIIVPVYNVEKYLRRCLDSLVNQTLKEIEIILIDDASLDHSADIMREYEKALPGKVRCIYQKENRKQGAARNAGIKAAHGEFILFVDSDDWVDLTMCEKLYHAAAGTKSDIVFCDFVKVWEDTGKEQYIMEVGKEIEGELTPDKKRELFSMNAYPVAKLIRSTVIRNHHLAFTEELQYEDQAVVPFFFLYSGSAAKVNEALYFYNIREASTMRSKNDPHHFDRMITTMQFLSKTKEKGFYETFKEEIDMFFIRSYCFYMLDCCLEKFDTPPIDKMKEISTTLKRSCPDYLSNYYVDKIIDPKYKYMAMLNDESPEKLFRDKEEFKKRDYSYYDYYEETKERAQSLIDYCRESGFRMALWGAGRKGCDFLKVNDVSGNLIDYVIDKSPDKRGETLPTGHTVSLFEDVRDRIDVVLVSNKYHYGEIYRGIRDYCDNIYVINLDVSLTYPMEIKDFLKL